MKVDNNILHNITLSIKKAAGESKNEKEFREKIHPVFEDFLKSQGSDLSLKHIQHEIVLADGKPDTVFNRLILEYKKPGTFNTRRKIEDAKTQLKIYIDNLADEKGWKKQRLLGVAFDGEYFIYIKYLRHWIEQEPIPVSTESVKEFCRHLIKLTDRAALIPENLVADFAIKRKSDDNLVTRTIQAFYKTLIGDRTERTRVLFKQWVEQFSDVHGAFNESRSMDSEVLRRSYGFDKKGRVELLPFFFSLETYFSILIKLLAYQVAGYYLDRKMGLPLLGWEDYGSEQLRDELSNLDNGGVFRERRIYNFIEGDFFGWYLFDWNEPVEKAVRDIIGCLNEYDPESLEIEPEYTRDLLKQIYQGLIPRKIRHDLGEYYTPDWLAERVLNQLNYGEKQKDLMEKRILDPGCGSGTFLVIAIRRAVAHAKRYRIEPAKTLKKIINNIQGFDLNPLAVIAARTNYLLAISDLLPYKSSLPGGALRIPVYLCDSINPPKVKIENEGEFFEKQPYYDIKTSVGEFRFAVTLIQRKRIQQLTSRMERSIRRRIPTERFLKLIKEEIDFNGEEWELSKDSISEVYEKLQELDRKGINGIWANIIKNAYAPLFVGQFDLIAGNPPWVNWESLPQGYRDATKQLWVDYSLFSLKGHEARLGGGKKDISMLFTYVSMDRYLKENGRLCFVITQTLFKTKGAGDGFRRFRLGEEGVHFNIEQVDDMVELQPFEGATNRTAIFSAIKGEPQKYPVPYLLWKKKEKGSIGLKLKFKEVFNRTQRFELRARPVGESRTSPWITAKLRALSASEKAMGASLYRAYEGANSGGANGVYWIKIIEKKNNFLLISNLNKVGKKKIEAVSCTIEPDLVFPLLRGRDVMRWEGIPKASILVTQNPETRSGYEETWMQNKLPRTYNFLKRFKKVLIQRSGYRKYLKGKPFYSMYNVGTYTFAPYKIVWGEVGNEINAAIVSSYTDQYLGNKVVVPDHTVVAISFENETEAHFVCALLNSSPSRLIVKSYIALHPSPHVMKHIAIPKYDPQNPTHNDLATLSRKCHIKTSAGIPVFELEEQIDQLAAELWGITEEEMKAIKESLDILRNQKSRR